MTFTHSGTCTVLVMASGFLFNFDVADEKTVNDEPPTSNPSPTHLPTPTRVVLSDFHKTIASRATPHCFSVHGDRQLRYLTSEGVLSTTVLSSSDHTGPVAACKALLSKSVGTDLVPSEYEGGLVAWEGAFDLVSFLSEIKFDFTGLDVLELGCGCGLPSSYALIKGARSVSLQDYNSEVIHLITIPSVLLNSLSDEVSAKCHFYSSSWERLHELISKQFDLILTSETIYSESSHGPLLAAITALLRPTGKVFIAAKSYYFGVGGSVRNFEELVKTTTHLQIERCKDIDSAVPRVVMCLRY